MVPFDGVKRKMAQMPEASLQLHISLHLTHTCSGSRALRDERLARPACLESWSLEGVKKEPGEHRAAKCKLTAFAGESIYNHKHAGRASISWAGSLKSDGFTQHQTLSRRRTRHDRTCVQSMNMPVSQFEVKRAPFCQCGCWVFQNRWLW